ncbi:GumC family protein [Pedobacter sp. KBS0701]|uniref:GumC family protein n=1 Tax=unclassified Pedobacter TaxID=2628915 RepID=UPI00110D65AE|nr:lipopolysaccharide biosynthesis protein [Pedobacter sp. KBS0701]QDW26965.1 lipopolysaccharide biosynthesis protein [Pedobacter sp. KBS0701]
MAEGYKFLKFVKRYRLALILVPLITIIITAFLVRNLKSSYISQAQISTGIVDETQQQSVIIEAVQGEQVRQQFSNLIEMIRMKRVLNQVSYLLIIHDLTAKKPFKPKSDLVETLNKDAVAHAIEVYRQKYENSEELDLTIPDQEGLSRVLKSMNYDADGLKNKISVFRSGESDFITVQSEAESPELAAYIVNTLSAEFIKGYISLIKASQNKANNFLRDMLTEKTDTLATRMARLKNYKIRNKVLNLTEQSKQLYALILDYDTKKQEAVEKTASYAGALNEIDAKFNPKERSYIESRLSKVNQGLVETKAELSSLYDLYLKNDLDERYKNSYDSLRNQLSEQINKSSDQYINNPLNAKQELVNQKINLEIQMDLSRYGINSLENKINALTRDFSNLVPQEAEVQTLEMSVDIASKEYLDILNKYNQSNLESGVESKMNIVQMGVGGLVQPSKKFSLVVLSGVVSLVFCIVALFVVFIADSRIFDAKTLGAQTSVPVLGTIPKLPAPVESLNSSWEDPAHRDFWASIRSIRYELESAMQDKVIVISSLGPSEGKSFFARCLARSWEKTNRKVLLIDGNFTHPSLSPDQGSRHYVEDFLQEKEQFAQQMQKETISVLTNRGNERSLPELASAQQISDQLERAKTIYDLIIIDVAAINGSSLVREWLSFTNDAIAVFKSGESISEDEKAYLAMLKESGVFRGWILNMAEMGSGELEFFKTKG